MRGKTMPLSFGASGYDLHRVEGATKHQREQKSQNNAVNRNGGSQRFDIETRFPPSGYRGRSPTDK